MNVLHAIAFSIVLAAPTRSPLETATAKYQPGMDAGVWYRNLSELEREAVQINYYVNQAPNH